MAKVPITTKGIKQVVKTLAESGVECFHECVKVMKDQDGVDSEFEYSATQELTGQYAVASDGQLGFILHAVPPSVPGSSTNVGGDANAGYEWQNKGDANVRLTVTVKMTARDRDAADGPPVAVATASATAPAKPSIGR